MYNTSHEQHTPRSSRRVANTDKRATTRRRRGRHYSDPGLRQIDREGKWFEDVATGDLVQVLDADELAALRTLLAAWRVPGYCDRSPADEWAVPINPLLADALDKALPGYGPYRPIRDALALSARGLLD